jgi:hypothetical protein
MLIDIAKLIVILSIKKLKLSFNVFLVISAIAIYLK